LQEARKKMQSRRSGGTNAVTFGEQLLEWWQAKMPQLAPGTITSYNSAMNHLRSLADLPLDKITPRRLDTLYGDLVNSGLSPASVRKVHYVAKGALERARRHGRVPTNVALDAEPPSMRRTEVRPPTVDELGRLLNAADDPNFRTFLYLAATTGARRGELCGLRWRDVNLDGDPPSITIRANLVEDSKGTVYETAPKSRRSRSTVLDSATRDVLLHHRARAEKVCASIGASLTPDRWVFSPRPGNDAPYVPKVMTRRTRRLMDRLGMTDLSLHGLRHFVGTHLADAGQGAERARHRLGHSRASTTLAIYTHAVAGDGEREAAEAIGRVVEAAARRAAAQEPASG
jgi:integrase